MRYLDTVQSVANIRRVMGGPALIRSDRRNRSVTALRESRGMGQAERNPLMASNPNRKLWVMVVAVHVVFVVVAGVVAGAGTENLAGFGLPFTVGEFAGVALMVVGLYAQRGRPVIGSWLVVVGLIPTLFSLTAALVLISGFWTANLVFGEKTAEIGYEALSQRRVDAFGQKWWVWLVAAGALLAVAYLALAGDNALVESLAFPAGVFSVFIGIGILGRTTDRQRIESASEPGGSTTLGTLRNGWWLLGAALIATVFAVVALIDFLETDEAPFRERITGVAVFGVAAAVVFVGLAARSRIRRLGSTMIAIGALPGAAAIVLFWHPGFVLFGLLSIAVITTAFIDAGTIEQPVPAHG